MIDSIEVREHSVAEGLFAIERLKRPDVEIKGRIMAYVVAEGLFAIERLKRLKWSAPTRTPQGCRGAVRD